MKGCSRSVSTWAGSGRGVLGRGSCRKWSSLADGGEEVDWWGGCVWVGACADGVVGGWVNGLGVDVPSGICVRHWDICVGWWVIVGECAGEQEGPGRNDRATGS